MNFCWSLAAVALAAGVIGAEPEVDPKDLPRIPATEPKEALGKFTLREGYRLELAAHEPNVVDPIAVAFDEDARMYVIEMRDYSERRDEQLGRVRLLEDGDNDGVYEKSTVFAENLPWPTAVICYDGGVFVGATPDILFLRDKDGDGRADEKRVVFTGFAKQQARLNVQQLMNSFHWGLDNRIHGASASNAGLIEQTASGKPSVNIGARDFSFDPRALTIRPESGGGQHGMSFDDFGRKFVSNNSSHIRMIVYEDRYLRGEMPYSLPSPVVDIAADGPAAEVFRTSPEEPWRRIRTQWRVAGQVSGPIEGGGRASGYFTGATGVHIYRGDACPDLKGNAFVGDAGGNLVHRKVLKANGVLFEASRPADELNREFLASRDNWFRPVQFANAPDGSLYIIDMYREVIEHPWSLPANIKKHLDLNSGNDRGRVWRVVPTNFTRKAQTKFSKATTEQLVAALAHANAWHRETAARLLYQRRDGNAIAMLAELARRQTGINPVAMTHAFYALSAYREFKRPDFELAMSQIRRTEMIERGLILAEDIPAEEARELIDLLPADSPSARVRHQLAWSIGAMNIQYKARHLARLAMWGDAADPWIRAALLVSSFAEREQFWRILTARGDFLAKPGAVELLSPLAKAVPVELLENSLQAAAKWTNRANAFLLASAVAEPLGKSGRAREALQKFAEQAATEVEAGEPSMAALKLLRAADPARAGAAFAKLFATAKNDDLRIEAFRGLASDPRAAAGKLFEAWPTLSTRARQASMDLLLAARGGTGVVISLLKEGRISRADLAAAQIQTLRQHPDPVISRPALELLGKVDSDRAAVIERLRPALALAGEAKAGAAIFEQRCASCHKLAGKGTAIGPDLESVRANGREYLLIHMIDPNREVAARFVAYEAELDGEIVTGILASETDDSVTLRLATGEGKTIPRAKMTRLRASPNSLMPIGLEEALSNDDVANLLAYIAAPQP